ncbi:MAG: hypothetical protein AB2993_07960 (plasmid) [Candidatus Symbiodolus clandestinus]
MLDTHTIPTWHPLSMLPTIALSIKGEFESMEEMYNLLMMARDKPSVLNDEIIQRTIRLCHDQYDLIPVHREQLSRWLTASPSSFQREEISRLAVLTEQHESLLKEVLVLTKELGAGTIDSMLRMDDSELGVAVFEGHMKPPTGHPYSENLRVQEKRAIAEGLDAYVNDICESHPTKKFLALVAPQLPIFHRLMEI